MTGQKEKGLTPLKQIKGLRSNLQKKLNSATSVNSGYDAIVIGLGSVGSSTLYHLAQKGLKVLGIEQFDINHEKGSHTGQSRIIRKAYFEHPDYVPLLERAYSNWYDLESRLGIQLYYRTGLLYFGKTGESLMDGVMESADKYGIAIEHLSRDEQRSRFPQFRSPEDHHCIFEPDAGFLLTDAAIMGYSFLSSEKGAHLRTREKVLAWEETGDGIQLQTDKGLYSCQQLLITAGAWTSQLIAFERNLLNVTRQMIGWIRPKDPDRYLLGKFPCWVISHEKDQGIYYGFPSLPDAEFGGPGGIKLGHHYPHELTDPDHLDGNIRSEDLIPIQHVLKNYIPGKYEEEIRLKACMYTNSPDEHFIIDRHMDSDRIIYACGFSGHGFKFASVVGEILADLALTGKSGMPIAFLRGRRFFD